MRGTGTLANGRSGVEPLGVGRRRRSDADWHMERQERRGEHAVALEKLAGAANMLRGMVGRRSRGDVTSSVGVEDGRGEASCGSAATGADSEEEAAEKGRGGEEGGNFATAPPVFLVRRLERIQDLDGGESGGDTPGRRGARPASRRSGNGGVMVGTIPTDEAMLSDSQTTRHRHSRRGGNEKYPKS
jgi:hypothetical protein